MADGGIHKGQAEGVSDHLAELHGILPMCPSLGKLAQFRMAPGQEGMGGHDWYGR
jgi:hypothetical protein